MRVAIISRSFSASAARQNAKAELANLYREHTIAGAKARARSCPAAAMNDPAEWEFVSDSVAIFPEMAMLCYKLC